MDFIFDTLIKEKEVKPQLFPSCGHAQLQHPSASCCCSCFGCQEGPFSLLVCKYQELKEDYLLRQQKPSAQSWHIRNNFWCGCFQKLILKTECEVKNNTDIPLHATLWTSINPAWATYKAVYKTHLCRALVAHACSPSYSGSRDHKDHGSKPTQANSSLRPYLKKKKKPS
jgi:hypothetical protein